MPYKKIYCIGIGGIGLSALAQLLAHEGHEVVGSDRSPSVVTELLEKRGIKVSIGSDASFITPDIELVIYSAAVHEDNPERMRVKELGIPSMTYFQALGKVSEGKKTIAVSGTHGKTTTTAMITKILVDGGLKPTAIIGSLTKDFESNFVAGEGDVFVVEACEYKKHFLHVTPTVLVITNIEWDHTDFFGSLREVIGAFNELARKIVSGGAVIFNGKSTSTLQALDGVRARQVPYEVESAPPLELIGEFNRENARAAKAAVRALFPQVEEEQMDASLQSFKGTWRRFEYKGKTQEGALVYDDYAHHPTAMQLTIEAAKKKFPHKKIIVAFHPHLYSRTKSLMVDFAEALSHASTAVIAPIFAAREESDPEVTSKVLAEYARRAGGTVQALPDFDSIEKWLRTEAKEDDVIITMGAGDIYKVADSLVVK